MTQVYFELGCIVYLCTYFMSLALGWFHAWCVVNILFLAFVASGLK